MVLSVVKYGEPVLRQKGEQVSSVTKEIQEFVKSLFETMYHARGIGLASQQVGRALQVFVIDVRGVTDRPSTLERVVRRLSLLHEPASVEDHMPMAFINPRVIPIGPEVAGPEGCLSFPEIYGEVLRPEHAEVQALDTDGRPFRFKCGGLLARAVQHEYDHLQGILFIDRMERESRRELKSEIEALHLETKEQSRRKH